MTTLEQARSELTEVEKTLATLKAKRKALKAAIKALEKVG